MTTIHNNISNWLKENEKDFLPPVCNKMMHGEGQLKVFYVGGPNVRKDFHIEEGEEFFYMVKGDMVLKVLQNDEFKDVVIKEGEVFLLPGKIPHSPQRFDQTIGLVVERERLKRESDCLRYFIDESKETLFEKWFYCDDLGSQLVPIIKEFFDSEQHKTGKPIPGSITSNPPWTVDSERKLEEPFSLKKWIEENRKMIENVDGKQLFNDSYKSEIVVYGKGEKNHHESAIEHWIWQIEGESQIEITEKTEKRALFMKKDDSILVKSDVSFKHFRPDNSVSLIIKMNPGQK